MITTSMLKRQVSMANDDEFDHMVKNSQRVLKLSNQYKLSIHLKMDLDPPNYQYPSI